MMLYPNRTAGKLRSWRGRHRHHLVLIHEVFNEGLQTVDSYRMEIKSSLTGVDYDSKKEGTSFKTIESAKSTAIRLIREHIEKHAKKQEKKKERFVYLRSKNLHNYRHNVENPRIIGMVHYTPELYNERLCFKVIYESDDQIDYIAYSELIVGHWEIIK